MANIREHCSWVHEKGDATTEKAIDIVRTPVAKAQKNKALQPTSRAPRRAKAKSTSRAARG